MLNALELEIIKSAQDLCGELLQRGREIDTLRQLPQDLAERMAELGFYRLITPTELGGLGLSPEALSRICETLASANGSAA